MNIMKTTAILLALMVMQGCVSQPKAIKHPSYVIHNEFIHAIHGTYPIISRAISKARTETTYDFPIINTKIVGYKFPGEGSELFLVIREMCSNYGGVYESRVSDKPFGDNDQSSTQTCTVDEDNLFFVVRSGYQYQSSSKTVFWHQELFTLTDASQGNLLDIINNSL